MTPAPLPAFTWALEGLGKQIGDRGSLVLRYDTAGIWASPGLSFHGEGASRRPSQVVQQQGPLAAATDFAGPQA